MFDIKLYPWGEGAGQVGISTEQLRGFFEHKDGSEGGGLWFEQAGTTLELVDYDGVYALPRAVLDALRGAGIIADESFE